MAAPSFNEYVDEMLLAVQANIEYLKQNGSSQIRISNGVLANVSGGAFIYQFQLEYLQEIDPGMEVEVRIQGQNFSGKIAAVSGNTIDVQLENNLGEKIAAAVLFISNFYLLEKLAERLERMKSGEVSHERTVEKLLGISSRTVAVDSSYLLPLREMGLNPSQEQALRTSLGSEITFIWGPPGTGKSETIGNIVESFLSYGYSVLLIAHTNKATDGAMNKVVGLLADSQDYKDGRFVREGHQRSIDPKLCEKNVLPERIIESRSAPIRAEIVSLQDSLASLHSEIQSYDEYLRGLEHVKSCDEEWKRLSSVLDSRIRDKAIFESRHKKLQSSLGLIQERIVEFQNSNIIGKLFSGTNLDRLTREKVTVLRQIEDSEQNLERVNVDIRSIRSHIAEALSSLASAKTALSECGIENFDPKRYSFVKKDIQNIEEQIKSLGEQLAGLGDNIIKEAKVVATTLTRSYMSKSVLDREYDCVILDEASMAPLPAVICAVGLAKKKAVLVGDFFQLPPIAKHAVDKAKKSPEEVAREESLVRKWLKKDIFDFVGITESIKKGLEPDWLVQLNEQFRMHPDISKLVNELVYQHYNDRFRLLDGKPTQAYGESRLFSDPLSGAHIGIYDTSRLGAVVSKSEGNSFYNVTHALLAVALTRQAIASGYTRIGVISAYRAQVNLINKMLEDELPESQNLVIADTVHRFQGDERELIIFDVTTPKKRTMYDDGSEGGDDMKLLNVAISRSKEKCIVLADVSEVRSQHSASSLVKRLITHCETTSRPIVDCEGLLHRYVADDRTETWLAKLNGVDTLGADMEKADMFNERDFYPHYIRDLLHARHEIIIHSPFITSYRSNILKPIFAHLLSRGVRIFIISRPPSEHKDAMREQSRTELSEFEKMGIIVLPIVGNIHQKFSIIDREILWDGSLNILSQRDSSEMMRRYVGSVAVSQLLSFLKFDKNIGDMGSNLMKRCETCKEPGAWYWRGKSRFGQWTYCLVGMHGVGKQPKPRPTVEQRKVERTKVRNVVVLTADGSPICPVHKILTVQKEGYWGPYWSCPKVKECDYQISDQKAAKYK